MSTTLLKTALPKDALVQARALIGMPIRVELWNNEATRDTIRHYAWGIGDDNPLYTDPAYAATSCWGTIIAPPTFLFGVFDAVVAPGLPDVHWFYSGADWFFDQPARRGDEFTVKAEYVDATEVGGNQVGRMLVQTGEVTYSNQKGERIARVLSHCFRVPRPGAEGGLKYEPREAHRYSIQELEEVEHAVMNEYRRGATPLYWEDVQVGDKMPGTVRGPLTLLDMTCYYAGAVGTSGYKSTKLKMQYRVWARDTPERIPNNYDPSYHAAPYSPSIGHQDAKVAVSDLGMPGPYDNGPQRIGMVTTCVTNWMGDAAFLREISVRLKKPVIFGDITFTKGEVTGKRIEGSLGLVEARVWAENQLGQVTATGRALVEVPLRP